MNEENAKKRIAALKGYYGHLTAYVAVNLFLMAINLITGAATLWFLYPMLGWGIGLLIHTAQVFWISEDWESRKLEQLTGLKNTRDELEKLSERTEALVTIMSSVDWENIDPSLRSTRENLENARRRIAELQSGSDAGGQAEVTREIEKLEEFVTSSRFDYYDRAAADPKPN